MTRRRISGFAIWPQESNIETKRNEKRTKYSQRAIEICERKGNYTIYVEKLIIVHFEEVQKRQYEQKEDCW